MSTIFRQVIIYLQSAVWGGWLWLLRALRPLLVALKEAIQDIKINSVLFLSLVGKVCWLLPLLVFPHLFDTFPSFYATFKATGPEWAWAIGLLLLVSADVAALMRRVYWGQVVCLFLGMVTWLFFSRFVSLGVPHGLLGLPGGPTAYLYGFAALGCLHGLYTTVDRHGAQEEAKTLLRIRKMLQTENETKARNEAKTKENETSVSSVAISAAI